MNKENHLTLIKIKKLKLRNLKMMKMMIMSKNYWRKKPKIIRKNWEFLLRLMDNTIKWVILRLESFRRLKSKKN